MRPVIAAVIAAAFALAPQAALATACTITTTPSFAFTSAYDVFSTTAYTVSSKLSFGCDAPASYTVSLGAGTYGSSVANRAMRLTGGTDVLAYNLYTSTTYLIVFGDGSSGSRTVGGTTNGSNKATVTIYGRLPAQQDVSAGSYGDTVTLTISY